MEILKIALGKFIDIIIFIIVIKAFMSWIPGALGSRVYQVLDEFTYPIEYPIRKFMGGFMKGPLDFTPMIAMILLIFIRNMIFRFL